MKPFVVALAILTIWTSHLEAQSVRGRIFDDQTAAPVGGAAVALLVGVRGEEVVREVLSDSLGRFWVSSGGDGRYRLSAERIGYREVVSPPFDLVGRDTLDVELRMSTEAIPLAPLTVVSERMPLLGNMRLVTGGFVNRRDTYGRDGLGAGHFLTEDDWAHRSPTLIAEIVREVPGVRIVGASIRMTRITGFNPYGCEPSFYLDGNLIRLRGESIDDILTAYSIKAVEVYTGPSRPAQFMDMLEKPCGAIVLWTG